MEIYESAQSSSVHITLRQHTLRTFTWMTLGLAVTFITAVLLANNLQWLMVFNGMSRTSIALFMIVPQLGIALVLSARILKMNTITAKILFLLYSFITGITFSVLALIYTGTALMTAFGISTLFFGSLVVIGYTTKADLTKIGTVSYCGLFVMIIYSLFSMLFGGLGGTNYIMAIIGLALFVGITAWDTQRIKTTYYQFESEPKQLENLSIFSAFQLYLDFINIFLYILRLLGRKN